jgi:hypothetical protein
VQVPQAQIDDLSAYDQPMPSPVAVVAAAASAATQRVSAPVHEGISLDAVRNSLSHVDSDDLDVPAFIRKRLEN